MGKLHFPHPLTLLVAAILLAAVLTHILPAGRYQRRDDPASGRTVVVAGSYQPVERKPVGPFAAMVAIPKGMASAGAVIFLVFLVGGSFTVVEKTGALTGLVNALVRSLAHREVLAIPMAGLAFAAGGALFNMAEEIIAFVPVLVLLARSLGFDAVVVVAVSVGSAAVGAAFSPINPFQAGIAQKVSSLPLLSGWQFRLVFLALALAIWLGGTMRYALHTRIAGIAGGSPADAEPAERGGPSRPGDSGSKKDWRQGVVLALVLGAFVIFAIGILKFGWDFDQMSALFFVMGAAAGLIGGLGIAGTAEAFVEGFRSLAFAGLLIGFARAIYVVLEEGQVVDTIVHALFAPISHLPVGLSAVGMMAVQTVVHFPVPSVSGQAVLTLPLLVPLSDLLGLSRQVTVLAYQFGAGLCELVTPTNGALMAMLVAAGVRYERWLRFLFPIYAALLALSIVALELGIAVRLM